MRLALVPLIVAFACGREPAPREQAVPSAAKAARGAPSSVTRWAQAETLSDPLTALQADVRARAVRALASSSAAAAREPLLLALGDDAPEVLPFAAFGLGRGCAGREGEVSAALAIRAANLLARDRGPQRGEDRARALRAFADALGRCGGPEAERTLRGWLALDPPEADAAALALGRVAGRRGGLEDASAVSLLDAAARTQARLANALYPFTRFALPEGSLRERLIELARRGLDLDPPTRSFAARALGRLGAQGAAPLGDALARRVGSIGEQCEIARELGRAGPEGRAALALELTARAGEPAALELARSPGASDVVLAILEALGERSDAARPALQELSRLEVPSEARSARRAVELRCGAARLLAGSGTLHPDLRACDPDPGGVAGKLSMLFVLDRGKLSGGRDKRFLELAADADARVRQAALRLLPAHRELQDAPALIARGLQDTAPGVVAAAAEFLAKHPDRVQPPAAADAVSLFAALGSALRTAEKQHNVEVQAAIIDAVAALGVLSLTTELERACASDNTTLRERAERALQSLGRAASRCTQPATATVPAGAESAARSKLVFDTDAGELTLELDPTEAPRAVTRIRELAKSGFYTDVRVHRVVSGFVVQLGDPGGDGYGGAPLPPVKDELGPSIFEAGDVGLAQSGRDTGNSQFFVTLGRFPHLDGEYARLGRAAPGWDRLRVGDRIKSVKVVP